MFWLILAVILWGVVHSVMASMAFKDFLRRRLGNGFMRAYRLSYNIFSAISFAPILYLMATLPNNDLYQVPSPWSYLMLAGQGFCVAFLFIAVLQTDTLSFVGLRQLFEDEKAGKLVTKGFYRFMRHPLYTFGLLILWLSPSVTVNSFVVYVALTVYIFVGAFFEERKLLREFGQEYADYRSVTPMIVPGLKFNGNK
ncbi:MAG: isoprenylcysteine carboxylmethyltransferase family protein [Anaerolineales bacterium]|nr:isoprenylcysteine carboxylmethyltransferase family protein [Anaerolineales bacterium]